MFLSRAMPSTMRISSGFIRCKPRYSIVRTIQLCGLFTCTNHNTHKTGGKQKGHQPAAHDSEREPVRQTAKRSSENPPDGRLGGEWSMRLLKQVHGRARCWLRRSET